MCKFLHINLFFIELTTISAQLYPLYGLNPKQCRINAQLKSEIAKFAPTTQKIINTVVQGKYRSSINNKLEQFENLVKTAKKFRMANVHEETFEVLQWSYPETFAEMKKPKRKKLKISWIASSNPKIDFQKKAIVFDSFIEMEKQSKEIKGKIVVFNLNNDNPLEDVKVAGNEFFKAMQYEAAAVLSASIVPPSIIRNSYAFLRLFKDKKLPKYKVVPSAYISFEDANMLRTHQNRGENIEIHLKMVADGFKKENWKSSVAEIKGTKQPGQVVMVYGNGFHPNALCSNIGVVLQSLGLKPRRTLKFVNWYGSFDNGLINVEEVKNIEFQIALLRDQVGPQVNDGSNVIGVDFVGSKEAACVLHEIVQLLKPLSVSKVRMLNESRIQNVLPLLGYNYIPHTFGTWSQKGVKLSKVFKSAKKEDIVTAIWAVIAFVIADLSEPIPRNIVYFMDEDE